MKFITIYPLRTLIDHKNALKIAKQIHKVTGPGDLKQIQLAYNVSIKEELFSVDWDNKKEQNYLKIT